MAVREHDERAVGKAEPEIGITNIEVGDGGVVLAFDAGDGEAAAGGEVGEEGSSRREDRFYPSTGEWFAA
jgi:hypothetical protein